MRESKCDHTNALVLTSTDTRSGRTQVDPGTTTVLGACLDFVPPPSQFAMLMLPVHLQVSVLLPYASSTKSRGTSACCKASRSLLQLQISPETASFLVQPRLFDRGPPPVATLINLRIAVRLQSPDWLCTPRSPHSAACPTTADTPNTSITTLFPSHPLTFHFRCLTPTVHEMARSDRMRQREDDFLSESDLSASSVEGSVRRTPDRPFTDRDESTPRRRVAQGGSGSRDGTDSSDLSASSDNDDDDEQVEEKLIGSAGGSGKASAKTPKAKAVRHGPKKAKKSRRMWEMRSGEGAAAPAAQSVSSEVAYRACSLWCSLPSLA